MIDVEVERTPVNVQALDAELRAEFGVLVDGLSARNGRVIVHLSDESTPAQITQAQEIVNLHDPAQLTAEQQANLDRQQVLDTLRQTVEGLAIDPVAIDQLAEPLRTVAQKVRWLEQEVMELRGPAQ